MTETEPSDIDEREEQLVNALLPRVFTDVGIVNDASEEQTPKALPSIDSTDSGIWISNRALHP